MRFPDIVQNSQLTLVLENIFKMWVIEKCCIVLKSLNEAVHARKYHPDQEKQHHSRKVCCFPALLVFGSSRRPLLYITFCEGLPAIWSFHRDPLANLLTDQHVVPVFCIFWRLNVHWKKWINLYNILLCCSNVAHLSVSRLFIYKTANTV